MRKEEKYRRPFNIMFHFPPVMNCKDLSIGLVSRSFELNAFKLKKNKL